MYLVSRCVQLDNYNLSYWLQLLSAVTLSALFSAKTNQRLRYSFGTPQVVTLRCFSNS